MKYFLFLIVVSTVVFACVTTSSSTGQQGISGQVFWLEGNLMPSIGDTSYVKKAAGSPVQRTLYIYEPTTLSKLTKAKGSEILYSEIRSSLVKKIKTNDDGTFRVELPPGRYSVFTLEEKGFFANVFDGEGIINPVTVEDGIFTDLQIKINYKAFF